MEPDSDPEPDADSDPAPDAVWDPGPVIFVNNFQGVNKKLFCLLLFEGTFISFSKDKKS
jgi:hypothetical protein